MSTKHRTVTGYSNGMQFFRLLTPQQTRLADKLPDPAPMSAAVSGAAATTTTTKPTETETEQPSCIILR